jgi:hypothetical protein
MEMICKQFKITLIMQVALVFSFLFGALPIKDKPIPFRSERK